MDHIPFYIQACDKYRAAHDELSAIAAALAQSAELRDQRIGEALVQHPERVKLENLPQGAGIPFEAHYNHAAAFDVKNWPHAAKVAEAMLTRVKARMDCERAYEKLSPSERSGIDKPSDIIAKLR